MRATNLRPSAPTKVENPRQGLRNYSTQASTMTYTNMTPSALGEKASKYDFGTQKKGKDGKTYEVKGTEKRKMWRLVIKAEDTYTNPTPTANGKKASDYELGTEKKGADGEVYVVMGGEKRKMWRKKCEKKTPKPTSTGAPSAAGVKASGFDVGHIEEGVKPGTFYKVVEGMAFGNPCKKWHLVTDESATKKTETKTKNAPSPSGNGVHARDEDVGTVATGADNNEWIVVERKNGSHFWKRVPECVEC